MKKITVIIPALNEEKAIKRVLASIPSKKLKKIGYETEVMEMLTRQDLQIQQETSSPLMQ